MFYAPVPGYGAGRLDIEGNFAHYVDRIILGAHNYAHTKTWDPEGIVSTLPSIATCLMGILAGHLIALPISLGARTVRLAAAGIVLMVAAQLGDPFLPINKSIWTSTFTLWMAGIDCVLFAAILWIADGLKQQRWFRPFVMLGMNAIAVYMASELLEIVLYKIPAGGVPLRVWIYRTWFAPLASPLNASLLYAVTYTLLMLLLAWVMHRRGWFVRV